MLKSRLILVAAITIAPAVSQAANYRHPYTNVDPRNDAGNDTGDAVTEQLNAMQLQPPYAPAIPRTLPPRYVQMPPLPRYYTPPPGYMVAPAYPAYGW